MKFNYLMIAAALMITLSSCDLEDVLDNVTVDVPYDEVVEFDFDQDTPIAELPEGVELTDFGSLYGLSSEWDPASEPELKDELGDKEVDAVELSYAFEMDAGSEPVPSGYHFVLYFTGVGGTSRIFIENDASQYSVSEGEALKYEALDLDVYDGEAKIKNAINTGTPVLARFYFNSIQSEEFSFSGKVHLKYKITLKSK